MDKPARIHIPFSAAAVMVWGYFRGKVCEQIRSVSFIILYLLAFQVPVLLRVLHQMVYFSADPVPIGGLTPRRL